MTPLRIQSLRTAYTDHSTRSNLIVDAVNWGYAIEDVVRPAGSPKVYGKTAIPAGIYQVAMYDSPHFKKRLPHLMDVLGYDYVLAHGGNTAADTLGCLCVASKIKALDWIFESISDKLASTVEAALRAGHQVTWEVIDTIH